MYETINAELISIFPLQAGGNILGVSIINLDKNNEEQVLYIDVREAQTLVNNGVRSGDKVVLCSGPDGWDDNNFIDHIKLPDMDIEFEEVTNADNSCDCQSVSRNMAIMLKEQGYPQEGKNEIFQQIGGKLVIPTLEEIALAIGKQMGDKLPAELGPANILAFLWMMNNKKGKGKKNE